MDKQRKPICGQPRRRRLYWLFMFYVVEYLMVEKLAREARMEKLEKVERYPVLGNFAYPAPAGE